MTFDWCVTGDHEGCRREFEKYYIDPKNNLVKTGEIVRCECPKRGCPCYVKAADRQKPAKKRKRKQ